MSCCDLDVECPGCGCTLHLHGCMQKDGEDVRIECGDCEERFIIHCSVKNSVVSAVWFSAINEGQ